MSKVFFVGCGPGDPDLITIKAKKLLQKADVVIYSGSLIPPQILKMCKKAKIHDASKLVREEIFDILKKIKPDKNGEIQITDALLFQANQGKVIAYKFKGKRFDCGSVEGYIKAINHFATKQGLIK